MSRNLVLGKCKTYNKDHCAAEQLSKTRKLRYIYNKTERQDTYLNKYFGVRTLQKSDSLLIPTPLIVQRLLGFYLFKERVKKVTLEQSRGQMLSDISSQAQAIILSIQLFARRDSKSAETLVSHSLAPTQRFQCHTGTITVPQFSNDCIFLIKCYSHRKQWKHQSSGQTVRSRKTFF